VRHCMGRTKKVGAAGRFGSRYGRKIRQRIVKSGSQNRFRCPSCMKLSLRRESAGIWSCPKCHTKLAGKAYKPE
jgi:large subunit ribosomal protein L37Ae